MVDSLLTDHFTGSQDLVIDNSDFTSRDIHDPHQNEAWPPRLWGYHFGYPWFFRWRRNRDRFLCPKRISMDGDQRYFLGPNILISGQSSLAGWKFILQFQDVQDEPEAMNRGVFLVALHPEVIQAQTEAILYPVYKVDELRIGSSGFNQERIFSISRGVFVLQRLYGDESNIHLIAHPVDLFQEVWDTLHRGEISVLEKIDVHPHEIDDVLTGPFLGTRRRGTLNLGLKYSPTPCNSLCPFVRWIV